MEIEEKFHWFKHYIRYVFARFAKDRCPSIAAELTVTTLLSLVPFLTVIFAFLSLFPQFQSMAADVQGWLFQNFIPESNQVIRKYLNEYVQNTRGLTSVGVIFLVVTSLLMMRTIDKSFNAIWQVKKKSSPVRVFLVYWAVLTMGPLLLAVSLAVSSYFASLPLISEVVRSDSAWFKRGVPMIMAFVAFTVMFIAVPNRKVNMRHAAIAAAVTAILFELAKWGFGVFVQKFSTYQLIFGALATVPLFLIWIQLSWMIVLFGAQICHALDVFQIDADREASHPFILAARILKLLVEYQSRREVVDFDVMQRHFPRVRRDKLVKVIEKLVAAKLIIELEGGAFSLVGDSQTYQLADIVRAGIQELPDEVALERLSQEDPELAQRLLQGRDALLAQLSDPLVGESSRG
jgi:membrane protein